mgnify:FL=1
MPKKYKVLLFLSNLFLLIFIFNIFAKFIVFPSSWFNILFIAFFCIVNIAIALKAAISNTDKK